VKVDGSSFVETTRIHVAAGTTATLTYTRDGAANTTYEYRCKAYASDTGTLTGGPKAEITTTGDTRFGAIISNLSVAADNLADYSRLYDEHRAMLGAPMGIRIYSPGRLPNPSDPNDQASWTQEMRWAVGKGDPITVSHKTADTARLTQLLNWAYTNNVHLTIIYFHEVQDDWGKNRNPAAEPSYYRQVFRDYRRVIDSSRAGAAGLIKLEKNLMWYYQMFRALTLGASWTEYVEANDPADQITWGVYAYPGLDDGVGRYLTADEAFRFARDSSAYSGRPLGYRRAGHRAAGRQDRLLRPLPTRSRRQLRSGRNEVRRVDPHSRGRGAQACQHRPRVRGHPAGAVHQVVVRLRRQPRKLPSGAVPPSGHHAQGSDAEHAFLRFVTCGSAPSGHRAGLGGHCCYRG
jgi:hypothetical protein